MVAMRSRLETDLSDTDKAVIMNALVDAAVVGGRIAQAQVVANAVEQGIELPASSPSNGSARRSAGRTRRSRTSGGRRLRAGRELDDRSRFFSLARSASEHLKRTPFAPIAVARLGLLLALPVPPLGRLVPDRVQEETVCEPSRVTPARNFRPAPPPLFTHAF